MRLLIANPFGIGDVLFSVPLVRALREADPGGCLEYLCNRRTEELVAGCLGTDQVHTFEKDEFRAAWKRSRRQGMSMLVDLIRRLRSRRLDGLVDLSLSWQYGFAGLLAGIRKRVGFDYRGRGRFLTDRLTLAGFHLKPVADYYLDLLPMLGLPKPDRRQFHLRLPDEENDARHATGRNLHLPEGCRWIGLVPGGGTSWGPWAVFKQWPAERFAAVALALAERFDAEILVFGDAAEQPLCRQVAAAMTGRPATPVQTDSLITLARLFKRCALVIGNDSGPLHLATAVGTPTVSVFGPVDASVYGPLGPVSRHRVVTLGLVCQPCYQGFRFPPCPWDNACLKELQVERVLQVAEELLNGRMRQRVNAPTET